MSEALRSGWSRSRTNLAPGALFLMGSAYVTGVVLDVDGGDLLT